MNIRNCSIFFLFVALVGCRKTVAIVNADLPNPATFHHRTIGASARELLDDQQYKSLTVEIQYMPGFKPQARTIEHLRNFLETFLNKPKGINIVLQQITSADKNSLSVEDVLSVEKSHRKHFVSGDQTSIYLLFTDGVHPGNKILGMAYQNTSAVIYGRSVRKYSSMQGRLTHYELETAVMLHEIGHLLGLVNKSFAASSDHADATYHDHCNNKKCLMYHSVETKSLSAILLKGTIPVLDQHCVDDLIANGGKMYSGLPPFY